MHTGWTSAAILELPFLCFRDDFFYIYNANSDLGFQHIHIKTRFVVQGVFMQADEAGAGKYKLAISFSQERFDGHYFMHFFASCDVALPFPVLLGLMFMSHMFQQETLVRDAEGDCPLETNTDCAKLNGNHTSFTNHRATESTALNI